jgi:hypothetical protein
MLSSSKKFLFIHVPKTGGNSIQSVLKNYSEDDLVCVSPLQDGIERFEVRSKSYATHKHSTLAEYTREYGEEMVLGLCKFCCVRNPWDRCVSHFFSPHRGPVTWDRDAFWKFVETEVRPLNFYIDRGGDSLESSVMNINYIIRFEHLQAGFDRVCQELGVAYQVLPVRNSSSRDNYRIYYDEGLVSLVEDRFSEEIKLFGYTFA